MTILTKAPHYVLSTAIAVGIYCSHRFLRYPSYVESYINFINDSPSSDLHISSQSSTPHERMFETSAIDTLLNEIKLKAGGDDAEKLRSKISETLLTPKWEPERDWMIDDQE